jgi:hypothetical protein
MPKDNIDYSNTIIYKIYCKDEAITDVYVGHTTNFVVRKYHHKNACNNSKINLKIYKTIRENGGWDNWDMIEIAKYECNDSTEARIKEQFHYKELKASLNSCPPFVDKKTYFCNICNLQINTPKCYKNHMNSDKHKKTDAKQNIAMFSNDFTPKKPLNFICEQCNFNTSHKNDYRRHLQTQKHLRMIKINDYQCKIPLKTPYDCSCGKSYKDYSGLWKHKNNCNKINKDDDNKAIETKNDSLNNISDKDLIMILVKQNAELLEVIKNGTNNNNHNTTNSHNKTFNLQFFLNEECKDALNIAEFVSSIKVQLEDLETTGRLGYVEGVSRIINKNLNDLDQTKRPIHCSDVKREVLYIKNDDQWIKENEKKPILTKAIKQIANENIKQISEWRKKYPDCTDSDSRKNDLYLNIVSNAMSGSTTEEQSSNYEKIIARVAKEVIIEK